MPTMNMSDFNISRGLAEDLPPGETGRVEQALATSPSLVLPGSQRSMTTRSAGRACQAGALPVCKATSASESLIDSSEGAFPSSPVSQSSLVTARRVMKQCREHTASLVKAQCLSLGDITLGEIDFLVKRVYCQQLDLVEKQDKHRADNIVRLARVVVDLLKEDGVIPMLDQRVRTSLQSDSTKHVMPRVKNSTSLPWKESCSMSYLNSDALERRKVIIWGVPKNMPLPNVSTIIEERGISLANVLKYRRAGIGPSERVEVFLEHESLRDSLVAEIRGANLDWKAAPGREKARRVAMRFKRHNSDHCDFTSNRFSLLGTSDNECLEQKISQSGQCKKFSHKGTILGFNLGTLNLEGGVGKEAELIELMESEKLGCFAVTETWFLNSCSRFRALPNFSYFGKVAKKTRASRGRGSGGIGFLVSKQLDARVVGETSDSLLWIRIRIRGGTDVFLAVVYAPQATAPKAERELFFDELHRTVASFKKKGLVILMGDFNARVGCAEKPNDHIGLFGEKAQNTNCKLMLDLLKEENLFALNGRKADCGIYTRIRSGVKSIIDYIVVDERIFSRQYSCRVLEDFDCGSDHHPVIARVHIPGNRFARRTPSNPSLKVWKLLEPEVQQALHNALDSRLGDWVQRVHDTESDCPNFHEQIWMSWKGIVLEPKKS